MAYKAFLSQSEQLKLQQKEALKQRIENIFFQLLNCYTNIVSNMRCEDNNIIINGKEYFEKLYNKLICLYSEEDHLSEDKTKLLMAWRRLNDVEKGQLSHYYRNLYQIFKWVYQQRENIPMEEQEELIDLIKAQLSTYEISLLYFNIEYFGANDFKEILNFYNFFPSDGESIIQQFKNHVALFEKKR
ncbi:putative phage abortive infection protein [Guptibacillus hwajinpoensis]